MKIEKMVLTVILIFFGLSIRAQTIAIDVGSRWQGYYYGFPGKDYIKQNAGISIGVSKRLFEKFEGRAGVNLSFFETFYRDSTPAESFWVSPGEFGDNGLMQWQIDLQGRWRPMGFDRGWFGGVGLGINGSKYYLAYDRFGTSYLVDDRVRAFYLSLNTGFDFRLSEAHRLQCSGSLLFPPAINEVLDGAMVFGLTVGWRWIKL